MKTKNTFSVAERSFWKDAFLAGANTALLRPTARRMTAETVANLCANFADAALDTYRTRIIWRKS